MNNQLFAVLFALGLIVGCTSDPSGADGETGSSDGEGGADSDGDTGSDDDGGGDSDSGTGGDGDVDSDSDSDSTGDRSPLRIEAECAWGPDRGDCNGAVTGGFNADLPGRDGADSVPLLKPGEQVVGYFFAGSWLAFPGVDLSGYTHVRTRVAAATTGVLEVRIDAPDGEGIAIISVPNTGSWETFMEVESALVPVSGVHTVYLVSANNDAYNGDVDWIEFFVDGLIPDTDTGTPDTGTPDTGTPDTDTGTSDTASDSGSEPDTEAPFPIVEARNPNMWADVPDMSIIRVGSNYYMSSTTMHLNPGVPIMKSTDLINWEVVNYAHQAIDPDNARLNLAPGQNAYGGGTWASSLRYHNNMFYVSTFSNTTGRSYIYRTSDIENGSWSVSVLPHYHDASLFFDDDGGAYFVYGSPDVRIIELTADATAVRSGGVNQVLLTDPARIAGTEFYLRAEGTQVQKINGWYYIHNIVWPVGSGRTQIIHRSRNLMGPYEGRVILSDNTAQGCLVDTPQGQWYAYLFRDSGAVGRIPYLVPVRWEDDWPVVGVNNRVPETLGFQVEDRGLRGIVRSDEFTATTLEKVWQWNHNPDSAGWSLVARPGFMRITNTRVDPTFVDTRNTLTQRMFGPTCSGTVAMELEGMRNGDYAGLGALQDKYGFVGVVQSGDQRFVVMVNASSGTAQEIARVSISQTRVFLRVTGDFRNRTDTARFYYSLDGAQWHQIGNMLNMEYLLTHFMGYRFALFHFGTISVGGHVDFDYFRVGE